MNKKNKLVNPKFEKKGYIQIYTGNGKGKTTASLGLTLRALGRNWKVLMVMFTKGQENDYGEIISFSNLNSHIKSKLKIIQSGLNRIVYKNNANSQDKEEALKAWNYTKKAINENCYDLIILDELNIVLDLRFIELEDVLQTLKNKPQELEIVITGRNAKKELIDIAHLVSEINPIKHYWDIGVEGREGIEY